MPPRTPRRSATPARTPRSRTLRRRATPRRTPPSRMPGVPATPVCPGGVSRGRMRVCTAAGAVRGRRGHRRRVGERTRRVSLVCPGRHRTCPGFDVARVREETSCCRVLRRRRRAHLARRGYRRTPSERRSVKYATRRASCRSSSLGERAMLEGAGPTIPRVGEHDQAGPPETGRAGQSFGRTGHGGHGRPVQNLPSKEAR